MTAQANELRIGNYHKTAGIEIPRLDITSVKIDGQAFSAITAYGIYLVQDGNMEFEPIPLSPEWLEKFGFGKSEDHEMGHNVTEPWGFYFDYHFKRFRLENYTDDGGFDQTMKHIQYVHQLQNLYFALTGSELLIKQEKV